MKRIPKKEDNPNGLHCRYYIQKYVGQKFIRYDWIGDAVYEPVFEEVDADAEYFTLRLDFGGNDQKHIDACRKAIMTYADEIKNHLPELSTDLIKRYEII